MARRIVTGVDVFADADSERPVASVQRVGGGAYRVRLFGESSEILDREDFPSAEEAEAVAVAVADRIDADPSHPVHVVAAASQIATLRDRVAELEAVASPGG